MSKTMRLDLPKPRPDREMFRKIILRQTLPDRVHPVELHMDAEIMRYFAGQFGQDWVAPESAPDRKSQELVLKNYIECWHRLGYDYVRYSGGFRFSANLPFDTKGRQTGDTAGLSRGTRNWVEEGKGVISSWDDFEKYPWPSGDRVDFWPLEFAGRNLPEGMGILVCFSQGVFEVLVNQLLGLETLAYLSYDNPELVAAVADRIGGLIYEGYRRILGLDNLLGFFQGDDLGYKTSTMVSPVFLRKYVLPWHKKFAQLAHEHNLLYILHSCGCLEPVMEDLIEDVRIDARHSFEDAVMPVAEFKRKYGGRIGVLGGVDVDKLCRFREPELRSYVREILDKCMPAGGYLLGSGNSVANYIPVENYLIMLDEGNKWSG